MGDFAANVIAPAVEYVVKRVVTVIKRQFIYLCCFVSNIAALRDEFQNLNDDAIEMETRVNAAKDNIQEIKPKVLTWLRDTNDYKLKTTKILNEAPNGCLARFSLSRSAVKISEDMALHREKYKLFGDDISLAPSSAASKPTPLGITYDFESRIQIEQDIMKHLRAEENIMIGICGMGGLGKTIMAKRIMNKALEERLFQEVVIVVVSKTVDELKIQFNIGRSLGLKDLEKESPQGIVQKLYERLTSSTKKTLLVLDDVWKIIKLKELGIPCGGDSKGCRILITSRNSDALKAMSVKKVFGMKELSEEDAWFLFKEKAGACVEVIELNSIAKQVVSKCKGLTIAIEIVGAFMKDERSKSVWKDALKQLKKPNPKNIPDFIAEVYKYLIVSYDKLDNDEVKSLFLLCCLFPEDGDIPVEKLVIFCMGLHIFEDMRSVGDVRDRVYALVKKLKTRSLLLDSEEDYCVRMHDVVRDVSTFVAKQKEKIGGDNATWISSFQLSEGEETFELLTSNLRLLLLDGDKMKIEGTFFEGMRELYVLFVEEYSWTSLPLPRSLKSIRALVLDSCEDLETISVVGGFVNLEILICRECGRIQELPQEIGGLKHLKVLDLSGCTSLMRIAPGIISSLVELEELKILRSFADWEADNGREESINSRLRELESLAKLTCLEIKIANPAFVAQQIKLSSKIVRFHIAICSRYKANFIKGCNKEIILNLERGACLGHWVEKFMKGTEYLYVMGNGANDLDLGKVSPNIRFLKLDSCESMKNMMETFKDSIIGDAGRRIEGLELSCLPHLQEIWKGPISSDYFLNIKTVNLKDLPAMKVIWTTPIDVEARYTLFPHIECLKLSRLPLLKEVWNSPVSSNSFQNLKKIHLKNLSALKQLWKCSTSVSLPQLQSLKITGCEMMEQLFQWSQEEHENADIAQHYYHLFCQPQKESSITKFLNLWKGLKNLVVDRNPFCRHISIDASFFNQLEELRISKYHGNISLFTPSIARNLANVRRLYIVDCDEMVQVIDDRDMISGGCLFPELITLELENLSKLVTFCKWRWEVELPLLNYLTINGCPNITSLVATLDLESFSTDISKCLVAAFKDLRFAENDNLHQAPLFSFRRLQYLNISNYQGSMGIFSYSVAESFVSLKELFIESCRNMVKVIEEENIMLSGGQRRTTLIPFPNLQRLNLYELSELESFCEWNGDVEVELPSLKILEIVNCPKISKFTRGVITTPHLKFVALDWTEHRIDVSSDLNGVLLRHYSAQQKEKEMIEQDEDGNGDGDGDVGK